VLPSVGPVPEFVTVIVCVSPVSPCVKLRLCVFVIVRSGGRVLSRQLIRGAKTVRSRDIPDRKF
jgi:hypothetical protein